jgi:outer membrane receptor protein involved in Fe transport
MTLKRAIIKNYDLRYEVYPGKGQILSVSAFYKSFLNPIEQVSLAYTDREITYRNLSHANNYGLEFECRFLVSSFAKRDSIPNFSSWAEHLTIFTNLAIIRSQVDLSGLVGAGGVSRPLQGQSPYVLNAGAMYVDPITDMTATVSLNRVGNRVFVVGNINEPDIWEKARTFFDIQLAKSFYNNKLEVKINAQNIFAQNQIFYQNDFNAEKSLNEEQHKIKSIVNGIVVGDKQNLNGFNPAIDNVIWQTNFGRVFSIAASYKF